MHRSAFMDSQEPPETSFEDVLNVAAVCPATRVLGPGTRAVVWVQGCLLHCPGCIAPEWMAVKPAWHFHPSALAEQLLADSKVTGLTFSGGEPMLQASALASLARYARQIREINIICFTGYQLTQLEKTPPGVGVQELLEEVDVLIDGPYLANQNHNEGLKGSRNQQVHYLSDRITDFDFNQTPRKAEVFIQNGQAFLVGVPPLKLNDAFQQAVNRARLLGSERLSHERA